MPINGCSDPNDISKPEPRCADCGCTADDYDHSMGCDKSYLTKPVSRPANICLASEDHLIEPPVEFPKRDAIGNHLEAVREPWDTAFSGPIVHDYKPGDHVWLYDHYNTGVIVCEVPGHQGTWRLTTTHADGDVSEFEYPASWLRPAAAPVVFTWDK